MNKRFRMSLIHPLERAKMSIDFGARGRRTRLILIMGGVLLLSLNASATTYYIAANGSDANNGTSKSTPWLHAPGMNGCAGNCAAKTPVAGDRFLFRGGDAWHYSAGAPKGLPWNWTWSGASGNDIYLGVDQTWYANSSFTRPILTMDNPLSTVLLSKCTYDDTANTSLTLSNVNYVTVDDFEFTGKCWAGDPNNTYLDIMSATHSLITSNYFHGWSSTTNSIDTHAMIRGALLPTFTYNEIAYNVLDGSDSFHGTTTAANQCFKAVNGPPCQSGFGIYGDGYNLHHNVFRYLSNGIVSNSFHTVHDNLFEYIWASYDDYTHPNVVESGSGALPGTAFYFYNNTLRHDYANVVFWPMFDTQGYIFNNVFLDVGQFGAGNCINESPATTASNPTSYIYNNTIDGSNGGCFVVFQQGNAATPTWHGTTYFENNQFIGYSSPNVSGVWICPSPSTCAVHDNGHEVFQSESAANGQGYTVSDNYAPTSAGDATVGAGANLTNSCSTFSPDSALCSGTSLGVLEKPGQGGYVAVSPATTMVARSSSSPWDAGAYQWSVAGAQPTPAQPTPPSALTAQVQ